jgi:hypothetical protein
VQSESLIPGCAVIKYDFGSIEGGEIADMALWDQYLYVSPPVS